MKSIGEWATSCELGCTQSLALAMGIASLLVNCTRTSAVPVNTAPAAAATAMPDSPIVTPPAWTRTDDVDALPALVPASLTQPGATPANTPQPAAAAPSGSQNRRIIAGEPAGNYQGRGAITVKLVSRSAQRVYLKIRKTADLTVAAQMNVDPNTPAEAHLDSGSYQMYLRADLQSGPQFFKGPVFELPGGFRGSVTLVFETQIVQGPEGQSLQPISPSEF